MNNIYFEPNNENLKEAIIDRVIELGWTHIKRERGKGGSSIKLYFNKIDGDIGEPGEFIVWDCFSKHHSELGSLDELFNSNEYKAPKIHKTIKIGCETFEFLPDELQWESESFYFYKHNLKEILNLIESIESIIDEVVSINVRGQCISKEQVLEALEAFK